VNATIAQWKRALSLVDRKIDFYDAWMASGHRPPLIAAEAPAELPALDEPKARKRGRGRGSAAAGKALTRR